MLGVIVGKYLASKFSGGSYEEVYVPDSLEGKINLIHENIGKQVRVLDFRYDVPLEGRIEELSGDCEYLIKPRFGAGHIMFSEYLDKLYVKNS